jgi:hypothetical protein
VLSASVQLTVSSTDAVGFPPRGLDVDAAVGRRDDVSKTSPVTSPPTPPPLRLDFNRQTVARTVSVSAAIGKKLGHGS